MSFPPTRESFVAWINFIPVILRPDRGIQLKILKLLVFFIVFWTPWSSHGVTRRGLYRPMPPILR
ncbi:ampG domain protein [Rickettsia amblyommatis str. Ac/Pa]|uniref:AmpG domain protein n=1 Tax=Rickettsia amblyommatis str. Ac/Pa TaxID=1359164 RepID=A0A0F3N0D9_RICAM|nr:ampG domain protein [Rickettsia amblyommatis str. Ac/Pa]